MSVDEQKQSEASPEGMSKRVSDATQAERTHVQKLVENGSTKNLEQQKGHGRDFFDMQVQFAENMARILSISREEALLRYTCLYRRLNQPHPLNPSNIVWLEFLSRVQGGGAGMEEAFSLFGEILPQKESRLPCFGYGYDEEANAVDIHFKNNDPHERGPLCDERLQVRINELKEMFAEIKRTHPDAKIVRGSSWIYNLPNYRRLFPPSYTEQLGSPPFGFTGMSIWGQFIDRRGNLRASDAQTFLEKVKHAQTKEEMLAAFPKAERSAQTNIEDFYTFYGIG